eukprot:COSAG06_NODE_1406_length_9552_cov_7.866286_2_plen_56_part_00
MGRKLALVGILLFFGRGSVLQMAAAQVITIIFTCAHLVFRPCESHYSFLCPALYA